jgi:energy-coupling factor transporter transmembrane protein EcfT
MLSRGFNGRIETSRTYQIQAKDLVFAAASLAAFYLCRRYPVVLIFGDLMKGVL